MMKFTEMLPGLSVVVPRNESVAVGCNGKKGLFYLGIGRHDAWGFPVATYQHIVRPVERIVSNYQHLIDPPKDLLAARAVHNAIVISSHYEMEFSAGHAWHFVFDRNGKSVAFTGRAILSSVVNSETIRQTVGERSGSLLRNLRDGSVAFQVDDEPMPFPEEFAHSPDDPVHWLIAADHDREW